MKPFDFSACTERQYEVALLLGRGCSAYHISQTLCIELSTVNFHISSLHTIAGTSTRGQLVYQLVYGIANGFHDRRLTVPHQTNELLVNKNENVISAELRSTGCAAIEIGNVSEQISSIVGDYSVQEQVAKTVKRTRGRKPLSKK